MSFSRLPICPATDDDGLLTRLGRRKRNPAVSRVRPLEPIHEAGLPARDFEMEVVINKCFGGFSLSEAAVRRYAELKGLALYPEKGKYGLTTYWTVPKADRVKELPGNWMNHSMKARQEYSRKYDEQVIYDRDIARDDPILVRVVRELGDASNGTCARLGIVEIPDGISWEIDEYDGNESIAETHRTWG